MQSKVSELGVPFLFFSPFSLSNDQLMLPQPSNNNNKDENRSQ
jgi:hypothetical protein